MKVIYFIGMSFLLHPEFHHSVSFAETEFDAIKSLILWYQNLPIPKTLALQTFQEFDSIYKLDDAKFKFLDTFNSSLGDLKRNFESILRLGALKVFSCSF